MRVAGAVPAALLLGALGCGRALPTGPDAPGSLAPGSGTVLGDGPLVFTASPVDPAVLDFILPLGNLNPPDHTLPSDHIYFYVGFLRPGVRNVPVVAPGDGTITTILRSSRPDTKIFVRVSASHQYYLDHVIPDAGIQPGTRLTAGQPIGTSGSGFGVDLGVINASRTLFFANPARYPTDTLHADAPLQYYAEPVRSQLYAMVRRESDGRDGRINYDVAGRLSGNWFLEGLPVSRSADVSAGPSELAFVFDNVRPAEAIVSSGGLLGLTGTYLIQAGAAPFADVSVESGVVAYRLSQSGGTSGLRSPAVVGTLLVQMTAPERVRAELVLGGAPVEPVMGASARTYVR
jgi:hypothetical protein